MEEKKPISGFLLDFLEDARDTLFGNERQTDLRKLSQRYGFDFKKRMDYKDLDLEVRSFPLFRKRKRKRFSNILRRPERDLDGTLQLFDCYKEDNLGDKATTAALLHSPKLDLAEFYIRPKRTTEKISGFFFQNERGLDLHPDFSKVFTVETTEIEAVHFYLTDRLMNLLLASPNSHLKGKCDYLMLYEQGKMQKPEQIPAFADRAVEIARVLIYDKSNELV
jgi:hypothetical protein